MSTTGEMIPYVILAVLATPRFAVLTLFLHRKIGQVEIHSLPDIRVQRIKHRGKHVSNDSLPVEIALRTFSIGSFFFRSAPFDWQIDSSIETLLALKHIATE